MIQLHTRCQYLLLCLSLIPLYNLIVADMSRNAQCPPQSRRIPRAWAVGAPQRRQVCVDCTESGDRLSATLAPPINRVLFPNKAEDAEMGECSICLGRISSRKGVLDCCSHSFCADCITKWAQITNRCPLCKLSFRELSLYDGSEQQSSMVVSDREQLVPWTYGESLRDLACQHCHHSSNESNMLLCDSCDKGYHMHCLSPPLAVVPTQDWFCPDCAGAEINITMPSAQPQPPAQHATSVSPTFSSPHMVMHTTGSTSYTPLSPGSLRRGYRLCGRLGCLHQSPSRSRHCNACQFMFPVKSNRTPSPHGPPPTASPRDRQGSGPRLSTGFGRLARVDVGEGNYMWSRPSASRMRLRKRRHLSGMTSTHSSEGSSRNSLGSGFSYTGGLKNHRMPGLLSTSGGRPGFTPSPPGNHGIGRLQSVRDV